MQREKLWHIDSVYSLRILPVSVRRRRQNQGDDMFDPSPVPNIDLFESKPVTVANLVVETFRVLSTQFWPFFGISVLIYSPLVILLSLKLLPTQLISAMELFLRIPAQSAMMFGVVNQMTHRRSTFGEVFSTGFSSLFPVLGTSFVLMLIYIGGLFCFVIPGIIAILVFYVAIPVAVVEDMGIAQNLRRSRDLTEGYRGTILGAVLLIALVQLLLSSGVQNFIKQADSYLLGVSALLLLNMIIMIIQATLAGVTYMMLRQ
ncbi:MAG: hypothetical protein AAGJ35_13305, partial [Myxococcota bacterium]